MYTISFINAVSSKVFVKFEEFEDAKSVCQFFKDSGIKAVASKTKSKLAIFAKFKDGTQGRKLTDFDATNFIILDIDETSREEISLALKKLDAYSYVAHQTYSCKEEEQRWRIILPIKETLTLEQYKEISPANTLAKMLGIKSIDVCSCNPVQPYYLPQSPVNEYRELIAHEGEDCFSVELLSEFQKDIDADVKPKKGRSSSTDDQDPLFTLNEAKRLLDELFKGNLIHSTNRFYYFNDSDGIWQEMDNKEMVQYLLIEEYQDTLDVSTVSAIVKNLEVRTYKKDFPQTFSEKNVLVLKSSVLSLNPPEELEFSASHYARHKLPFDYDKDATCPLWHDFLQSIWGQDADYNCKVALLQEYMGLSLTNIVKFQKMLLLLGNGSNGKSVILTVMRSLVGDNNASSVSLKDFNKRFSLIEMKDKLVNIDADLAIDAVIDDSKFKKIVAGDVITLEQKMEASFGFRLTTKQWAAANFLPRTRDNSHGFFRRILILTFNRVFADSEQDKSLETKLSQELPGILNWALQGLDRLLSNDAFTIPVSAEEELMSYQLVSDPVKRFLEEEASKVTVINGRGLPSSYVYERFKNFSNANGFALLNSSNFGMRLKALGIKSKRSNGKTLYFLNLLPENEVMKNNTYYKVADINSEFDFESNVAYA